MEGLQAAADAEGEIVRSIRLARFWSAAIFLAALNAFSCLPSPGSAQEGFHKSPHLEHTTWLVGAKFIQYNSWEPGTEEEPNEVITGFGGGLLIERTVIEHWLEIELFSAGIGTNTDKTVVPIDILFKKSFEFGRFNPYFGLGPSISLDFEPDGHTEVTAGGAFALGAYIWISDHVGIDFDIEYALIAKDEGTAQELLIGLGPVIRF